MSSPNRRGSFELAGETVVKLIFGVMVLIVIVVVVYSIIQMFATGEADYRAKRNLDLIVQRFDAMQKEQTDTATVVVALPYKKAYHIIGFGAKDNYKYGAENGNSEYSMLRPSDCGSKSYLCLCALKVAAKQTSTKVFDILKCTTVKSVPLDSKNEDKIQMHIYSNQASSAPLVIELKYVPLTGDKYNVFMDFTAIGKPLPVCNKVLTSDANPLKADTQGVCKGEAAMVGSNQFKNDPTWQKANPNFKGCVRDDSTGFCGLGDLALYLADDMERVTAIQSTECAADSQVNCRNIVPDGKDVDASTWTWQVQHNGMNLCIMQTKDPKDGGKYCIYSKINVLCAPGSEGGCEKQQADGSESDLVNPTWLTMHSARGLCILYEKSDGSQYCKIYNSQSVAKMQRDAQTTRKEYYCVTADVRSRGCEGVWTSFDSTAERDTAWARNHQQTCMARLFTPTNNGDIYGYECTTPGPVP